MATNFQVFGGEPFLRDDLQEIFSYAFDLNFALSIATNGMVQYLLTHTQAKRPQDRVLLAQLLEHTDRPYDRTAYRDLLERMFENMLLFMNPSKSTALVRNRQLV